MKIKYRSGYAEGGFLDDGATVDPMSGNEVPAGSLQEEVRDDIPAQLSEGEFVVPADVVRFIGLDKLMRMRDSAKKGLASMEAEGQIGGSPSPQDMPMEMPMEMGMEEDDIAMDALIDGMDSEGFEEQAMNFAEGGMPTYEEYTGRKFGANTMVDFTKYTNSDGDIITIKTIKGRPLEEVPEGYVLYVPPEEEDFVDPIEEVITPDYSPDAREGESREDRQIKVDVSNKVQRKRREELEALAGANLSQEGIDALYSQLTPQAKNIYNERFRDPKGFLDGFMAEDMSSTDLLITAQKTADRLNNERGVTETDDTSTYSTEPTSMADMAKAAKYMAAGLLMGPLGLVGVVQQEMTEAEKEEARRVLTNSFNFFSTSPNQNKGKGRGNLPTETQLTMPTFNQAHWVDRMGTLAGEGLTDDQIQKKLRAEKNAIPALYGTDAYGRKLGVGELSSYNNRAGTTFKDRDDDQDKRNRTLAKMAATAAKKKKEANIQDIMSKGGRDDKVGIIDWEENIRKKQENEVVQQILKDQGIMQRGQTTIDNSDYGATNDGEGNNQDNNNNSSSGISPGEGGGSGSNYSSSTSNDDEDDGGPKDGQTMYAHGGLAAKKKQPIKKMRKDPTSGLAAKKKSKQKAKAKKGALAAKRT